MGTRRATRTTTRRWWLGSALPGSRSTGLAGLAKPIVPATPAYHLEGPPEPSTAPERVPTLVWDPASRPVAPAHAEEPAPRAPAHALLPEDETAPSADPAPVTAAADDVVIDLVAAEAGRGQPEPWRQVVLAPEPDAVDHVLQALINRARFKQVGVEEVATELVERSDLQGDEVSDVLASLVGRADTAPAEDRPSSELTLFNDEVPSRPGQLTDFAQLARRTRSASSCGCCACSWPAPRTSSSRPGPSRPAESQSWPLARAVWPASSHRSRRRG